MLRVRYLTMEDLVRLGINKDPTVWGQVAPGSAYPVVNHAYNEGMIEVTVCLNFKGLCTTVRMYPLEFSKLVAIPTHESVAEIPRNDVRTKV